VGEASELLALERLGTEDAVEVELLLLLRRWWEDAVWAASGAHW
jgi:hypothetical protein